MAYIYIVGFILVGLYLIYQAVKEYKFLFIPAIYFIFLAIWRLVDILNPQIDLMAGIYSWILRGISLVVLVVTGIIYYLKYKKT